MSDKNQCPICLCDSESDKYQVFSCGHGMHLECMKGMGNKNCPTCRKEIKEWPKELEEEIIKNKKKYDEDDAEHTIGELRTEIEHTNEGVSQEEIEEELRRAKEMIVLNNLINTNAPLVAECTGCDKERATRALMLARGDADHAVNLILSNDDQALYEDLVEERNRILLQNLFQIIGENDMNIEVFAEEGYIFRL